MTWRRGPGIVEYSAAALGLDILATLICLIKLDGRFANQTRRFADARAHGRAVCVPGPTPLRWRALRSLDRLVIPRLALISPTHESREDGHSGISRNPVG